MDRPTTPGSPAPLSDAPAAPPPQAGPAPKPARAWTGRSWRVAGLLAVLVVAAVAAVWWVLQSRNTVHYATQAVTRGTVARTVTATGTVNPELTIIVGTYVSGVIQEIECDYNTRVKKGQVCARIDPRPYQTIVDQNRANLAVAKAQLEKDRASLGYAKSVLDRARRLLETSAVSRDAFENASSNYEQAKAQIAVDEASIQQRQAALDAALVSLGYTSIVSPVDGVVVSRNVTVGQTVAASFQTPTLFLIASDLTKMQVDTNVSESDIGDIRIGNEAAFTVDAFPGRIFKGVVKQVRQSPQTVQNVVTYDVVVGVDNPDLALKPGMTAATRIVIEQRDNVIRVPNAALRYSPQGLAAAAERGKARVWVSRKGELAAVAVVPGLSDGRFTEITGGELKPGDRVVTAEQGGAQRRTVMPRLRL